MRTKVWCSPVVYNSHQANFSPDDDEEVDELEEEIDEFDDEHAIYHEYDRKWRYYSYCLALRTDKSIL